MSDSSGITPGHSPMNWSHADGTVMIPGLMTKNSPGDVVVHEKLRQEDPLLFAVSGGVAMVVEISRD
jgi:hypothetical protein